MSGEIMCRIKFRARHRLNKMVVNADSFTVAARSQQCRRLLCCE